MCCVGLNVTLTKQQEVTLSFQCSGMLDKMSSMPGITLAQKSLPSECFQQSDLCSLWWGRMPSMTISLNTIESLLFPALRGWEEVDAGSRIREILKKSLPTNPRLNQLRFKILSCLHSKAIATGGKACFVAGVVCGRFGMLVDSSHRRLCPLCQSVLMHWSWLLFPGMVAPVF